MIPAARRSKILDIVKQRSAVSITDLEALLNVSPATIRRDLDILSDQHHLRRTHGGAIVEEVLNTTAEPDHEVQFLQMQAEKQQIGLAAVSLVEDGQSLILDSSSTVLELALALSGHRDLTVVTNDVMIARVLTDSPCIASLIVTGGTLRKHHYTLGGMTTSDLISGLRVDIAFLGVHAIDDEVASETDIGVARIKSLMANAARRVVVLADHSKIGRRAFAPILPLHKVDEIVTDGGIDDVVVARLRERGVNVHIASRVPG